MSKKLFSIVLFIGYLSCWAQASKKNHYTFINDKQEPVEMFEKAMQKTDLDSLRYLNERRKITIEGTSVVLELYSAQELFALYKKRISPLTKNDPSKARQVKLKLSPDKTYLRVLPLKEN